MIFVGAVWVLIFVKRTSGHRITLNSNLKIKLEEIAIVVEVMYLQRLAQDRKSWRKNPLPDFYAKPRLMADGSTDLASWDVGIPGCAGTDWEGGLFKIELIFPPDYPAVAPKGMYLFRCCAAILYFCSMLSFLRCTIVTAKFNPPIFHPNVFSTGSICLSILNQDWRSGMCISDILSAIQTLLASPNADHVTDRTEPSRLYKGLLVYRVKYIL